MVGCGVHNKCPTLYAPSRVDLRTLPLALGAVFALLFRVTCLAIKDIDMVSQVCEDEDN